MTNWPDLRIWPESDVADEQGSPTGPRRVSSSRAGGDYVSDMETAFELEHLDDGARARLTTILVDRRRMGDPVPRLSREMIEQARSHRPRSVRDRATRLLRFLAEQSPTVGADLDLYTNQELIRGALAHSDSAQATELNFLYKYLQELRFLEDHDAPFTIVSPSGYAAIEELVRQPDSQQAFVAMWLGPPMNDPYQQAIEPAIWETGFKPMRIDLKPDVDKIDDEIIGEIRRSRFLVADFTPDDDGIPRGGVYFEAGFARGLGLPVISTCRKDALKDVHFDTRQYYHIEWEEPELEAFKRALKQRILAVVGEGTGPEPATQ
ncbi:MAG: hypothetical protein OXH12_13115 [Chloroflexi bacterium]|nr:hypothetical protein [Chloroflexota bacterium]